MARITVWSGRETPPSATMPLEYTQEVDPDPRIGELEIQVERLQAVVWYFGKHVYPCQGTLLGRTCTCRLDEALGGTLWDGLGGEVTNITKALERLEE